MGEIFSGVENYDEHFQILQLGIIAIFLDGFMAYAFGVLSYIYSDRSILDERLERYSNDEIVWKFESRFL